MAQEDVCPIWGTAASKMRTAHGGWNYTVTGARTSGSYTLDDDANIANIDLIKKSMLTTWIIDQHRQGNKNPIVDDDVLKFLKSKKPLSVMQRIDRIYELAIYKNIRPGKYLSNFHLKSHDGDDFQNLMAWTESTDPTDMIALLRIMEQSGELNLDGKIELSHNGWKKLEILQSSKSDSRQAFVAMWFDDEMNEAYRVGIAPALQNLGYEPIRIDHKEHNNKIDDEIIAEIRRSKFIVADFTCGKIDVNKKSLAIARGGVYFEAGFAQGLGIPVIWAVRQDLIDHVHFDTRQFSHIVWTTPEDLLVKLYNRVAATIS